MFGGWVGSVLRASEGRSRRRPTTVPTDAFSITVPTDAFSITVPTDAFLPSGREPSAVTVAERTRSAVDARPFLRDALAAGVVNYAAAAETLSVAAGDDTDAVTAALRRYAAELSRSSPPGDARVRMERGLSSVDTDESETGIDADESETSVDTSGTAATPGDSRDAPPLFRLGGVALVDDPGGDLTAVLARGEVDARGLEHVLGRLRTAGVSVTAAGVGDGVLVVAVPDRAGATALRTVEDALG